MPSNVIEIYDWQINATDTHRGCCWLEVASQNLNRELNSRSRNPSRFHIPIHSLILQLVAVWGFSEKLQ